MPRIHIAGYDGSDSAKAAVRFARMLATADDEVVAATIYRAVPSAFAPGASHMAEPEIVKAVREEALALLEGLAEEGVRKLAVAGDSPAEGLHRLAEGERAGLMAVGVTHRATTGRLMTGGVGDRLLHGSPCPLAVVPASWDEQECQTVGVAFDVRDESRVAVREAEALAMRLGARLVVIAVYDSAAFLWLTSPSPTPDQWAVTELRAEFDRQLGQVVDELDASVRGEGRALSGPPGPTLVEASSNGIDLLVTGSRSYGPIGSVVLGSVSRYVADHAVCPLLVIPRGATGHDGPQG